MPNGSPRFCEKPDGNPIENVYQYVLVCTYIHITSMYWYCTGKMFTVCTLFHICIYMYQGQKQVEGMGSESQAPVSYVKENKA